MHLKYQKHTNGEVWRIIWDFERGWFSGRKIVNRTILAQDIIDDVTNEHSKQMKGGKM